MKKKYISLFIVSSVFTFLVLASFFLLGFISRDGSVYNFVDFLKVNYFTDVLIILAVSLFITVILLLFKKKYKLNSFWSIKILQQMVCVRLFTKI